MLKVKATAKGFYNKIQKEGDVFEIDSENDLGSWMEPIETGEKDLAKAKPEAEKSEKTKAKAK